ncbi:MAG TPA: APC family permease [Candidatus Dormibacteraeota bacterium]|nr:APC family permease [Candidatus Dormibacteraeota bacterium]
MADTSGPTDGGGGQEEAGLYTRQSSGLVRDISASSNIGLNIAFVSIPLAALVATEAPFAFPGASPFWVTVICAAICIFPVLLYSLFTAVMPRSGGDYVFVSRTLHPWVGFAANFNIVAWYVLVIAYFAYLLAPLGVSSAFSTLGSLTKNATLTQWATDAATNKGIEFGLGAAVLILVGFMMTLRLRRMLRVQGALFAFSLLSVVIAGVLLLTTGRAEFAHDITRFGGNYAKILSDAHKAGYTGGGTFSLGETLLALPLAFASFGYAVVTAYAGGEVRSPKSSGRNAMVYALVISGVVVAILLGLADRTFGVNFLGSATYLSNTAAKTYPFAAPSFFFYFVGMLTTSTPLLVVMSLSFIAAFVVALPVTFLIATRSIFAWSFDRILPDRLSDVSERTHSPLVANFVVLGAALIFLTIIVFVGGGFLQLLYTAGLAEILTFFVVAIAGIIFPFRRRALYESSPINFRWLGLPAISVTGVLSLIIYIFFFVSLATQSALGANATVGIIATVVIAAIGIVIFPISYALNRRRGVDLSLAFRELPPE